MLTGEKAMRGVARRSSLGFLGLASSARAAVEAARAAAISTHGAASLMTAPSEGPGRRSRHCTLVGDDGSEAAHTRDQRGCEGEAAGRAAVRARPGPARAGARAGGSAGAREPGAGRTG